MPTSVRLSEDSEKRLNILAKATGRSKAFYVRKAIENELDDLEDIYLAEKRLEDIRSGKSRTYTLEEVEKELGLDD